MSKSQEMPGGEEGQRGYLQSQRWGKCRGDGGLVIWMGRYGTRFLSDFFLLLSET